MLFTLKQYGPSPEKSKQAVLISGLPSASKLILTIKGKFALMLSFSRTSIPNNLSSPAARGPFGTVAQQEIPNKMAPPMRTAISMDFIITNPYGAFPLLNLSPATFASSRTPRLLNIHSPQATSIRAPCETTWGMSVLQKIRSGCAKTYGNKLYFPEDGPQIIL